jgi:hypothetical protein
MAAESRVDWRRGLPRRVAWLGVLNFVVLQWFGVRLARVMELRMFAAEDIAANEVGWIEMRPVTVGWRVMRWLWPLTGWWSDYRWIAKR